MSALERAFERARALNVDLVELAARIERDGSGATASASAREGTLLDALDALATVSYTHLTLPTILRV